MSDELVRAALRREADEAPPTDGLWAATTTRVRRRRQRRQVGTGLAGIAVMALATVVIMVAPWRQPDVVLEGPAVPAEWHEVVVGDYVLAVPPGWEVVDDAAVNWPDSGDTEPAASRLAGGEGCPLSDDAPVLLTTDSPLRMMGDPCPGDPQPALVAFHGRPLPPLLLDPDFGERIEVGGQPAWRHEVPGWWERPGADLDGDRSTEQVVVPRLGAILRLGEEVDGGDVEAILDTLRPRDEPDEDAVIITEDLIRPQVDPRAEEGDPTTLVLWALDADAQVHRWHERTLDVLGARGVGQSIWPAATSDRFGTLLDAGGDVTVLGGRPGEEPAELLTIDGGNHPDWSPDGTAVGWLDADGDIVALEVARWEDADAIADGTAPERHAIPVEGLSPEVAHAGTPLAWRDEDGTPVLAIHVPASGEELGAPLDPHNLPATVELAPADELAPASGMSPPHWRQWARTAQGS